MCGILDTVLLHWHDFNQNIPNLPVLSPPDRQLPHKQEVYRMHLNRGSKLTQPELLRLESFLRSPASGDSAMGLSRAHGFLTAIVSGPEDFESDEWIRLIFDEPVFDDSEQAQDVLGLIVRLHADIEQALPIAGRYSPLFESYRTADTATSYSSDEWCKGYISAMALWSVPLPRALGKSLEPLFLLANPQGQTQHALRAEHYDELCVSLTSMVEDIYHHWHGKR